MKFRFVLFIAALYAVTGCSCNRKGPKYIREGEIHYALSYEGQLAVPVEFLPKSLTITFKDDKILFELISSFGKSGILNLANPDEDIYDTYYTFFSRKYYYAAKENEVFPGFSSMDGMILSKTKKTAIICGYNCKNAEITFKSDSSKVYNVWYTEEIGIQNSNSSNPFSQIDGVLLSFFFKLGTSELHFEADAIYSKDVPDKTFERRKSYKRVSKDDINKFITTMISY